MTKYLFKSNIIYANKDLFRENISYYHYTKIGDKTAIFKVVFHHNNGYKTVCR